MFYRKSARTIHVSNISNLIVVLVASFIVLVESNTDIYTPCLPMIKYILKTKEKLMQWTILVNLIGLSISGVCSGPLSDYFGRRPIILIGNCLFFLSSLWGCFVEDILALVVCRFFQGIGGGVATAIGYAIIKDLYKARECSKVLSFVGICVAISPGIAPLIGGYIADSISWRWIFYIIATFSFVILIANFLFLKETKSTSLPNDQNIRNYCFLLKNTKLTSATFIQSFVFARVFAESLSLPFLYIEYHRLTATCYGMFMFVAIMGYVAGALVNGKYVQKLGINNCLFFGITTSFITSTILLFVSYLSSTNPLLIEIIKFPGAFSLAFIFSNATTVALDEGKNFKGSVSSFIVTLQTLLATIFCIILSNITYTSYFPIAVSGFICTSCAFALYRFSFSKKG